MPHIIITGGATAGIDRCLTFMANRNAEAAGRARQAIARYFRLLAASPGIGRPSGRSTELRELIMSFGDSGYIALYRHDAVDDTVYVLAFRHQREAGY